MSFKSSKGPNQPISEMAVHGNVCRFIKKTRIQVDRKLCCSNEESERGHNVIYSGYKVAGLLQ